MCEGERLTGLEDEVKAVGSHTEEERFLGLSGEGWPAGRKWESGPRRRSGL